mgnify:CR=1 FL=1
MTGKSVRKTVCGMTILATLAGFTAAATAGDKVMLKSRYKPGEKIYYQSKSNIIQTIKAPMGEMEFSMNQLRGDVMTVVSSSKTESKLTSAMDRMSFEMSMPMMGDLKYDSDIPSMEEAPPIRDLFKPMLGEALTFTLDGNNKVSSVGGVQELIRKVEEGSQGNPFIQGFKQAFTEEEVKQEIDQLNTRMLPNREIEVGGTRTAQIEESLGQLGKTATFDCTFKLDRIGDRGGVRSAFISFTGKPKSLNDKIEIPGGGLPAGLKIKGGKLKGEIAFDIERGVVVKRSRQVECDVGMPEPEKNAEGDAPAPMNFSAKTLSTHSSVMMSMKDREEERKKNAKLAAELKAREEKEFDGEDTDDDDDSEE